MIFALILSFFALMGFCTTVYLRYKILVWLGYRFLSGMVHHEASWKRMLTVLSLLLVGGWTVLYLVGYWLDWFSTNIMIENVDKGTDNLLWLSLLPVLIVSYATWKIIRREFFTFLGFRENDWNWKHPNLRFFYISPKNLPDPEPRRPSYGKKSSGEGFFSNLFEMKCTPSDEEWQRYG